MWACDWHVIGRRSVATGGNACDELRGVACIGVLWDPFHSGER